VGAQVVVLFAVTEGYMDNVPVSEVPDFESKLLEYMRARHSSLLDEAGSGAELDEDALRAAIEAFKASGTGEADTGAPRDPGAELADRAGENVVASSSGEGA